jgi:glycosyltransferase involved in cell wall biosynthesis
LPPAINLALRDTYALIHDRRFISYCRAICRQAKFDFIYERAALYHRTGCQLSKNFGIPLILEVNSPLEELLTLYGCAPALNPVASYIEQSTARKAHSVVVGSAGMRRYLIERGVTPEKIFTIYPTADDHFFLPARRRAEIRQKYDLEGKMVVGFIGSMAPYQRVDLLLHAAVEVRRVSDNVQFFVVGDGPGMASLKRFVADHDLEDSVSFTGRVPYEDIPEYCGAMDVCVIPHGTWYGSPTKLFEYAASGKPVIAPLVEPIQELIRDGENGLLTEVGDVGNLAEKIMTLAQNPELRARLGAKLHKEIMQAHTWDRNTAKLIEIFEAIKRNGHGPAQSLL